MRAPSMRSTADVVFSGPFFEHDANEMIFSNIEHMMEGIAQEGERAAREGLLTGADRRALVSGTGDRVADHVVGRVVSVAHKHWVAAAVVGVYNQGMSPSEATSLMAAASSVERRTRAIGRVASQLRSARAVLSADLTHGLE